VKPISLLTVRSLRGWVFGAAFSFIPAAAAAQNPRPPQLIQEGFIGDLAFTQPRGEIQISSLLRAAGPSANRTASVPLQIEYGITDDIQVNIETGGFNYVRPTGWSSPGEFHLGLRYGRYGLLPNLHASVTIEAESRQEGGKPITNAMSGLQLGVDIPPLRMTHIFTSAVGGVWNSSGTVTGVDWVAGVVVPFGQLRATFERPLRLSDPATRGTVPGLVWKGARGLDIGVATTLRSQPRLVATGLMLSLLLEF
jgi:hypothetical protein